MTPRIDFRAYFADSYKPADVSGFATSDEPVIIEIFLDGAPLNVSDEYGNPAFLAPEDFPGFREVDQLMKAAASYNQRVKVAASTASTAAVDLDALAQAGETYTGSYDWEV